MGLGTWDLELGTERERKKEHGGTLRHKMLYRSQAQEKRANWVWRVLKCVKEALQTKQFYSLFIFDSGRGYGEVQDRFSE